MPTNSDGLPLVAYARMVWRRKLLVLTVALAMAGPAYAVSALQTAEYQADGEIVLGQQQLDENFNLQGTSLTDTQMNNQIAILTGATIAERARRVGGISPIDATARSTSNIVTLSAMDTDPQQAAATVSAYFRAFSDYRTEQQRSALDKTATQLEGIISRLQGQISRLSNDAVGLSERTSLQQQVATVQLELSRVLTQQSLVSSGLIVVQEPQVPQSPVSPTPVRDALLALVLGLVLGMSLAVLLESIRARSGDEAFAETDRAQVPGEPPAVVHGGPPPADARHASGGVGLESPTDELGPVRPTAPPILGRDPRPRPRPTASGLGEADVAAEPPRSAVAAETADVTTSGVAAGGAGQPNGAVGTSSPGTQPGGPVGQTGPTPNNRSQERPAPAESPSDVHERRRQA